MIGGGHLGGYRLTIAGLIRRYAGAAGGTHIFCLNVARRPGLKSVTRRFYVDG